MKELRLYQSESIKAIFKSVESGITNNLLVLATGLGKTVVAVNVAKKFKSTLFIVDSEELAEQAALSFLSEKFDEEFVNNVKKIGFIDYMRQGKPFSNGFKLGLIKADVFQPYGDVTICSAQTLHKRIYKLHPEMYDCVIVDEAHCFLAATYFKGVSHFLPKLRLGLSATPQRMDGLLLSDLFQQIVYEYNIAEGIKDGYLVEIDAIRIKTNISLDKVKTSGGELNITDLSNEVDTLVRNNIVCESYIKYCNGRQAIGYAVDINHAIHLADAFKEKGINADVISSNEELTGDRQEKVRLYKEGKINVLFNVGILTKGFDDPNTSCIIAARPTKSLPLYLQCLGRGTRTLKGVIDGLYGIEDRVNAIKNSGKRDCIILDITDNSTKHNIVNCWELDKGLSPEDRVFITSEKRAKLLLDREKRANAKLNHVQEKDERVSLLQLPTVKISKSLRMSESATPAQLAVIERWGYDIVNTHYSKEMVSEIFGKQSASAKNIEFLAFKGYDVKNRFVSVAEAMAASEEIKQRNNK